MYGRHSVVGEVDRHLHDSSVLKSGAERLDARKPAVTFANGPRDRPCRLNVIGVEVDGDRKADGVAQSPGKLHTVGHRGVMNRDKERDVDRPDPRVDPTMGAEVDSRRGDIVDAKASTSPRRDRRRTDPIRSVVAGDHRHRPAPIRPGQVMGFIP